MALGLNYTVKNGDTPDSIAATLADDPDAFRAWVANRNPNATYQPGEIVYIGYELLRQDIRNNFEAAGAIRSAETPVEPFLPVAVETAPFNSSLILAIAAGAAAYLFYRSKKGRK